MVFGYVLATGVMGTAILISAKDIIETRPGEWIAGAERLLRGKKIHVAETGSPEEVDKWVADHDGTTEIPAAEREAIERQLNDGPTGDFDWTDAAEERAAGWPGAQDADYQDPGLTAACLADEKDQ
jgi:hypothetical protein